MRKLLIIIFIAIILCVLMSNNESFTVNNYSYLHPYKRDFLSDRYSTVFYHDDMSLHGAYHANRNNLPQLDLDACGSDARYVVNQLKY